MTLDIRLTTFLLCLDMFGVVRLYSVQELLTARRVSDMLHTQAHTLLDVSVPNDFVYDDTNSMWCDVVHDTCAAVFYGLTRKWLYRYDIELTHGSICGAYPFVVLS